MLHRQCGETCGELTSDFESERGGECLWGLPERERRRGLAAAVFGVLAYSLECRMATSRGDF